MTSEEACDILRERKKDNRYNKKKEEILKGKRK